MDEYLTLVAAGITDPGEIHLDYLKANGYVVDIYPSTRNLQEYIMANVPNVLLIDIDTLKENAIRVTQNLKDNPLTYTKPVIIIIGARDLQNEIRALEAGAEDFIVKPFSPEILSAHIHTIIRRNIRLQVSNPLTGLPGAIYIEEQASKRLLQDAPIGMCYVDLDHFKAYNDKYGYRRGDNVIRILATILNEGVSMHGCKGDFVGHVGGDDFIMIVSYDRVQKVCDYVIQSFDILIPYQYDEDDRERGFIVSTNRQGEKMQFPIMTVSIGIVTNENRKLMNYIHMTELAAEMKEYAKSITKSSPKRESVYRIDQRTR